MINKKAFFYTHTFLHRMFQNFHRVDDLLDEIQRLNRLLYQHEARFDGLEAQMARSMSTAPTPTPTPTPIPTPAPAPAPKPPRGLRAAVKTLMMAPLTALTVRFSLQFHRFKSKKTDHTRT